MHHSGSAQGNFALVLSSYGIKVSPKLKLPALKNKSPVSKPTSDFGSPKLNDHSLIGYQRMKPISVERTPLQGPKSLIRTKPPKCSSNSASRSGDTLKNAFRKPKEIPDFKLDGDSDTD
jgi:hypothetical protein